MREVDTRQVALLVFRKHWRKALVPMQSRPQLFKFPWPFVFASLSRGTEAPLPSLAGVCSGLRWLVSPPREVLLFPRSLSGTGTGSPGAEFLQLMGRCRKAGLLL